MSEEKKPAEQLDAAQTEQELAKKRNAFLRYMTIVFAVAFLLVLVSLVLQMHTAKAAMSDLKESNSSALTNAAANAELLQDDNRKLQEQVDALTAEHAEADEARSAQAERIAALEKELESVLGRKICIQQGKNSGQLTLEYYGADDLERLTEALRALRV